ncbi:hypothetical protein DYD21_01410 [Rhodohalobacter sp. SW132]|uniref:PEP-utilizing enzyme n=1 Tax=Rhodohalobacter sp. SW132 TaxID=2293433 RepID=UPI000E2333B8|nr:PEP-utilizing enzyme [Rhodohalobacter sp. SW132]REL38634.1 hypothetical protein DYD21_01410 [Rhodohalobacter sp. SW132]
MNKARGKMQVFIFGAARTQSSLYSDHSQPILERLVRGHKVLDWTLYGLSEAGIAYDQISFVGGYQIEKIIREYPQIHYAINPRWESTHVLGSLRYAMENWQGGDLMFMYADTVFRPSVFQELLQNQSPVLIGVDKNWRERLTSPELQYRAEKVISSNGTAEKVGRQNISPEAANAQFSGLMYLKEHVVRDLYEIFVGQKQSGLNDQGSLTDLLIYLKDKNKFELTLFDHSGDWAELDSHEDLAHFIFGTKAETLERIRPFVKKSVVTDQIHFPLKYWEHNSETIIKDIQHRFQGHELIVRSSSLEEDSWDSSQAGAFLSVAGVSAGEPKMLDSAVEEVISGFRSNGSGTYNPENQVLVQPFITDVEMSGVAFTRHLENGTPYILINYDDQSNRTDTVTSGSTGDSRSILIYKNGQKRPNDLRLQKITEAVEELESITGYSSLDIEFVLSTSGVLYVVQVRPITTHTGLREVQDFHSRVEEAKRKIKSRCKPYPHIYGENTLLADMPDWNPAEMIGVRPKPLDISLYQYLITDSAWRVARGKMGYHDPAPEKLMFSIGGHPYIDVRNSFNNLIPKDLSPELSEKLINHYVQRLKENPHLHDKIEFDIAITCFSPDIDHHLQRLIDAGFTNEEINELKSGLHQLTEQAVVGDTLSVDELIKETEKLNPRREKLLQQNYEIDEIPSIINILIDDCINFGTIPFSIMARYGFIASSMMKGLVAKGAITKTEKDQYLNTIETVAGELVEKMDLVLAGKLSREDFLNEFGHLRPGSYDITTFSYREKPEYYFPLESSQRATNQPAIKSIEASSTLFSEKTMARIEQEIETMEMKFSAPQLLEFIRKATAAREYAKFQFTKNLDAVLTLITEWGFHHGFTRQDMSYLFVEDILRLNTQTIAREPVLYIKQKVQDGRTWHEDSNKIETPQIILSPDDLDIIEHNSAEPNYVSTKSVTSAICKLSEISSKEELVGKIVLTEGADPGYDWIFLHPIKGLITKYGGAASHMTIRCAEFGLPAAIGCGEELFDRLQKAEKVELNCANKQIRVLG